MNLRSILKAVYVRFQIMKGRDPKAVRRSAGQLFKRRKPDGHAKES